MSGEVQTLSGFQSEPVEFEWDVYPWPVWLLDFYLSLHFREFLDNISDLLNSIHFDCGFAVLSEPVSLVWQDFELPRTSKHIVLEFLFLLEEEKLFNLAFDILHEMIIRNLLIENSMAGDDKRQNKTLLQHYCYLSRNIFCFKLNSGYSVSQ